MSASDRNRLRLHAQPVRTEDANGDKVTLTLAFDGETSGLWRQLFAEALRRRFGEPHDPGRPVQGGRVEAGRIILLGVRRNHEGAAWEVAEDAVREANAHFDDSGEVLRER